ncbi:MAG TPA: glycosyltransferase family 2 protein [Nodosilinea sp.]|nr:glycosyltransferase family 2 protein [Nodosilinea sp.]
MTLKTPVIFLIFNRPKFTQKVFEEIAKARPEKLLIVADGPRNEKEFFVCEETRKIIDRVNWPCEVLTNYSESNLGCGKRVSSGLDWAFSIVEEAIILEDDCLPSQSFFHFCNELLEFYRDDQRIWVIGSNNFQNGQWRGNGSYYFSRYNHVWGWATWRRAWQQYDGELETWPKFRELKLLSSVLEDPKEVNYWTSIFDSFLTEEKIDTWDCQWTYTCWSNSGLTILPNVNLVSNIGFGPESTHTNHSSSKILGYIATGSIDKIKHPSFIVRDNIADAYTFRRIFDNCEPEGFGRVIWKIKVVLGKLKRRAIKAFGQNIWLKLVN